MIRLDAVINKNSVGMPDQTGMPTRTYPAIKPRFANPYFKTTLSRNVF